jgi:two-component system response regulator YesN
MIADRKAVMPDKTLTRKFSKSVFSKVQRTFSKHFRMPLETTDINGVEEEKLCGGRHLPEFCRMVRSVAPHRCRHDRIRSLSVALETGQPYISFCHAGIAIVCVPIMDEDVPLGGLFFGKCLFNEAGEAMVGDILNCLKGLNLGENEVRAAIGELPVIPGRQIHQASEFLYIVLYELSGFNPRVIRFRRQKSRQQSMIGEFIQEKKQLGYDRHYPVESERLLVGKVRIGDRTGAMEILNSILGTLMLQAPGEMDILKARMIELLSVISRAAAEGGGVIDELLPRNLEYIHKIMRIGTQDELGAWINAAMEDFIEVVRGSRGQGRAGQLAPAKEYIELNCHKPISLGEVAKASHLSPSRLAHIFKERLGLTVVDYTTQVRIERAKELLLTTDHSCLDIGSTVGYSNQSYFTRTFRDRTGMTPRLFRQKNRKNPHNWPKAQDG